MEVRENGLMGVVTAAGGYFVVAAAGTAQKAPEISVH
jgi:hypothetical protein